MCIWYLSYQTEGLYPLSFLSVSSLSYFTHNLTVSNLDYQPFFVNKASSILKHFV